LWKAAEKDLPGASQALAEAAGRLATKGQKKAAEAICVRLLKKDLPAPIKGGALVTLARVAPAEAKPLIQETLAGSNSRLQTAAISAARIAFGKSTSATLAEWYPKLNPATRLLVLRELDSSAEKLVLGAVADADESVRLVALETLGRIGGAASMPVLLKSAADSPAPIQRIANASLTRISGPGADAALQKLAGSGDPGLRAAAIRAMGDRTQVAAVATLLKYAADTNRIVSGAACVSLGKLGGETEVEPVAKLAMSGSVPEADAALGSILSRIENKDAAATKLATMSQKADNSQVAVLFGAMATLGGRTAMQAVLEKTSSADDGVKDAAIRALANWPDFAAVKPLLEIGAKSETSKVHQVLALRGVARLARSSEQEAPANRIAAAQMVLKAAQRDEEKKEAIATLGAIVSPEAVAALAPLLADSAMKAEAAQAGINLAQSLRRGNRRAAEDMVKDITAADVSADLKQKAADALKR
jgi:HEAT repeat protein